MLREVRGKGEMNVEEGRNVGREPFRVVVRVRVKGMIVGEVVTRDGVEDLVNDCVEVVDIMNWKKRLGSFI
jgi:hypothetical protein